MAYVIASILFPGLSAAQQQLLSDPEIYEKDFFRQKCTKAVFDESFITRLDINNDGIIDAIANHGDIACDGKQGVGCNEDGCPYNFYLQVKEGGYFMIATAQIYGYEFIKRFGNMVFVFKMAPRYCDRTGGDPCEMTVRVRGARMVTISRK
ncbi:hypothetical protein [Rhizobium sp. SSA_523]|uniref:hypothetical protein n=1 Tax=Rhizobium sp. SSA_523 TaxID=2952477 RepID=UPI002091B478|nr:hypothetical protein [Rhizobium sp. SSA_523]MCO5732907.1 hypothetical protein [Rhizobium sp. SSA_523]WKC25785.1 hypothetical protein QTJ18_22205 [Rhizobium sp. SSA_523]